MGKHAQLNEREKLIIKNILLASESAHNNGLREVKIWDNLCEDEDDEKYYNNMAFIFNYGTPLLKKMGYKVVQRAESYYIRWEKLPYYDLLKF